MSVIKLKKDQEVFKGGLLVENPVYKPFRYPWCYDAWLTQQRIHWLPEEVPLGDDVRDWQKNLSQEEKNLLTQIFRFFTQADVEVNYCYLRHYTTVFKPTEVLMMMTAFAAIGSTPGEVPPQIIDIEAVGAIAVLLENLSIIP